MIAKLYNPLDIPVIAITFVIVLTGLWLAHLIRIIGSLNSTVPVALLFFIFMVELVAVGFLAGYKRGKARTP